MVEMCYDYIGVVFYKAYIAATGNLFDDNV